MVCMRVSIPVISINQKVNNSRMFKFHTLDLYHLEMILKFLCRSCEWFIYKHTQKDSNALHSMHGISSNAFYFVKTVLSMVKLIYIFDMPKYIIEYGMNNIYNLLTGPHKRIRLH